MTLTKKPLSIAMLVLGVFMLALPITAEAGTTLISKGTFVGKSDHATSGTVTIWQTDDGVVAVLESDFSHDGAPDPKLGFGKDGYDTSTTFTKLNALNGKQTYKVPASIDPAAYNEFYVWCEQYSVPLGLAKLK